MNLMARRYQYTIWSSLVRHAGVFSEFERAMIP
jgi:hypothetical protein